MRKRARSTEKGAGRWALICFLSGLVLALTYNVQAVWFLCFLAPISLFAALMKETIPAGQCFFRVFCFFGGYYMALLYWFGEMISVVGSSLSPVASVLVMVLAILLVAAIESAVMGVAILPFAWLRSGTLRDVPALAAFVVLGEWLIGRMGTLAFPWARMANLAAPAPWFVQSAGLLGGLFVSGIILCVAGFAAFALLHTRRDRRLARIAALCAVGVFAANAAFGVVKLAAGVPAERETEVLLVQGNYLGENKWSMSTNAAFREYMRLSRENKTPDTRIIVWPETAITTDLNTASGAAYRQTLSEFCQEEQITLVTGAFFREDENHRYNSQYVFLPDGIMLAPYHKQLLVPMGEFVPLLGLWQLILPDLVSGVLHDSLERGTETVVWQTPEAVLSGIICYESINPAIPREGVQEGAELLVMITNDSWFGSSAALRQHLSHAVLRAVETGRSLVRVGNSGITAWVDACGRVRASIPINESNTLLCRVPITTGRTLYTAVGDWPMALCGLATWATAVLLRVSRAVKTRKKNG